MDLKLSNLKCIEKLAAGWYNMDVPLKILQMRNIMEINAIESDSFNAAQFKRLRKLEFINVPIKVFKNGAFNGLTDLRELQIHRAVVAEVEENMLAPLQNLGEFNILDCRGNGLEINHFFGPVKMERLKYVTIKHCPFKDKIIESTFSGLSSVVHLNLNGNEIEEIGEKSLDVLLQTLKVLDLSHNKLQTLPVDFLKKIMRKKDIVIFFSENRWRCDIVEFIEKNRILNIKIEKINCRWDDIPTMQNEILVSSASEFSIEASSTSIETTQHSEEKTPSNSISTFDENSTPIESEHVTILDMCTEAKQKLLPLPSKERILLIYAEDGHLFIDTDSFGSKFELIAFRVTSVREVDGNTVNCMTDFQSENSIDRVQNMNSKQNIQIEPKLHQAYQFCLLERRKNIAIPLSYVFFHLNNGEDPEPWILGQHKLIFIMVCVLGALLVPVSGIGISFVLAIFFPKMIRSQPPKKSVLLTLKGSIKPKRLVFKRMFFYHFKWNFIF